ncbi:MAG: hemolysin III family protein [Saprospiraceae bacterium]|nr:hemolysin III family protein [Saprospiraceae bacterium]
MTHYTRKQEIVNGLTAGPGILFGVSGIPVLVGLAIAHNNIPGIIGSGIYGFCFLFLFTSSTVYHFVQEPGLKKLFRIIDHISIYFMIAGTYTPFLLVYMNNTFGISLLTILWVLTALGIVFKIYLTGKYEFISTLMYVLMGWIMVVGGKRFLHDLPSTVLILVASGGVLYTVGVLFYHRDRYTYSHAVWHLFVLAAAVLHFVAVMMSM